MPMDHHLNIQGTILASNGFDSHTYGGWWLRIKTLKIGEPV